VRILLDEQIPLALTELLEGHDVDTVVRRGWAGIRNGDLLQRMRGEYDVLVTMDRGIEFQQNITVLSFGVLIIHARSNRVANLAPLVPASLDAVTLLRPGQLHHVGT
jgi:hypothetical protein